MPAGRPRDTGVDERIAQAALRLMREQGPQAVHVDGVAALSGVARTTVYRRYRDRDALITATLARMTEASLPHADLLVADKLRWVLEQVRDLVEEQVGRGAVAAVLADSDPVFAAALRRTLTTRLGLLQRDIDGDIRAGQLRPGVDAETLAGLAFGAYLGELLQHGRSRRGWADRVVELLLHGVERT
ncbi:MAG: TetR/AcrR family transcriptional regulator [Terrabacter sp.]